MSRPRAPRRRRAPRHAPRAHRSREGGEWNAPARRAEGTALEAMIDGEEARRRGGAQHQTTAGYMVRCGRRGERLCAVWSLRGRVSAPRVTWRARVAVNTRCVAGCVRHGVNHEVRARRIRLCDMQLVAFAAHPCLRAESVGRHDPISGVRAPGGRRMPDRAG
eukprot:3837639-Prymnesium_polylepis.1